MMLEKFILMHLLQLSMKMKKLVEKVWKSMKKLP